MSSKKKIVLVEDEPDLLNLYQAVFTKQTSLEFHSASDKETAFNLIKEVKPDLALIDIIIPAKPNAFLEFQDKEGFRLLRKIRKDPELAELKVIMLTNLVTPEDKAMARQLKTVDFVIKSSVMPAEVVKRAMKVLRKK